MSSTNLGTGTTKPGRVRRESPSLTTQFVSAEEIAQVEKSFQAQRRLSFRYGFVFFLFTLLIPFLSGTAEWWYGKPLIGGLTLNFWTTLFIFHVFYWVLAYFFVKRANQMDEVARNQNS